MIHIYYHIYAIDGVEAIIDEQLNLIKKHFDFPYKLNIGISIADENKSITNILNKIDITLVRDIRAMGHEFTTLDLLEKDKEKFGDSDYILYLHTKGASKQNDEKYQNIKTWRHVMNYFNIEKVNDVFKLFERSSFNTYGILFYGFFYSGNFWWMKGDYARTINTTGMKKNRFNAEIKFIQSGENWKPYSPYDVEPQDNYSINFKREDYAK